ncbi:MULTISPECIES: Lrp/AsnC family transcriptional regulator [Mycolicibacterium]|nr:MULTISPECIES: Lrp/AsnC family transcriptional regulator [Mycolicibacterium]
MTRPLEMLDPLALRITEALQVNGRASWRRIAEVLDEPVRTVARRGAALLEDRTVQVVGLTALAPTHLLRVQCRPDAVQSVARALAARPDTVFVYALAESAEVIAEVTSEFDALPSLLVMELDGVITHRLTPVLQYFRTVAEWRAGVLTPDEVAALELPDVPPEQTRTGLQVDDVDRAIIDALVADGRTPFETIASLAGFSQATARRRIDQLIQRGFVRIRAVVGPALLGLPVEALLWIRCAPQHAEHIGTTLARSPLVRYAAMVMGEYPVVVDVTAHDTAELRGFLTTGPWEGRVESVHSTLLLQTFKRGGVVTG